MNKKNNKNMFIIQKLEDKTKIFNLGKRITNSTSKIKKIKEIRKNCKENDWCLFSHGENPHSNGDNLFS